MSVSVRNLIQSRLDPNPGFSPPPSGAGSNAAPLDLLGADPDQSITYQSTTAEALLSAEAANIEAPFSRLSPPSGTRIDARA